MNANEQYCYAKLFIILYKVILIFTSVGESLLCDQSVLMRSNFTRFYPNI